MKKLFSLLTLALLTLSVGAANYVKVTADADLTNGTYLIVYEGEESAFAFDGGLEALDVAQNTIAVTIEDGKIAESDAINAATFTIDVAAGTILSASGYYIGRTGDSNGLTYSKDDPMTNSLSIDADGNAVVKANGGAYLRYNASSGQERFRYFKSGTYTNQKPIALYKKEGGAPVVTVAAPTLPDEQNFDDTFTVTITNNEEGATLYYSFDGETWTEYTAPIVLEETTTVYAKATKDGVDSRTVSATYTKNPTGAEYELVTNVADLAEGDKIILVNPDAAVAMGASRGNNFGTVDVTVDGNKVIAGGANIITLEANGNNWNLKTDAGYLYAASSTGNQMKLETTLDENGNANAAITIDGDSAIIVFQGTNSRNVIRFNARNNPQLFSCYAAENTMSPVYIYKATGDIPEPPVTVADPVIDPSTTGFTGSQVVTITCATQGADIYYSINDADYQLYQTPITITEDSTVLKAYAELNGVQSNIVTAKYYKRAEVSTIAQANNLENKKDFVFYGNVVVVYQNANNLWVKDETGYGLIYGNQVPTFEVGTTLDEEWEAQHYLFRGKIHEYQYPSNVKGTDAALVEIVPTEYQEADLTEDKINERVIVKGLTLTAGEDAKYLYTADGMPIYNQFNITYPESLEGTFDVEGMVSYYSNAIQIMPITITPSATFTPGDVNEDGEIDINDVTLLIDAVLSGDFSTINSLAADCNNDQDIDINDVTMLIDRVLNGTW